MTRSTPRHRWTPGATLLLSFLLVPALLVGCTKNDKSKGPGAGSSITGTATNGLFSLTVNPNPNNTNKGGSVGITVLAQTLNGAPLANRNVQMATSGGTLASVAGSTDAAGKFVTTLAIPPDYNGPNPVEVSATVDGLTAKANVFVNDLGPLTVVPATATLAPSATQVFNCVGGVPPYRWEPSGGTLNTSAGPAVTFTAGNQLGVFDLKCRDSAGNAASARITIQPATALAVTPSAVTLAPGQTQVFQASGGVPPYTWSFPSGAGTLSTTTGPTTTLTAGTTLGTFTLILTDSTGATRQATITISGTVAGPLTILPGDVTLNAGQVQVFQARGGVPPYSWTATGGTPTTGTGNSFTYTAGSVPGTFSVTLTDSINQAISAKVTISVPALTLLPDTVTRTFGATPSGVTGTCSPAITITFTVSGGGPPYSLSATAGTVTPSTLSAAGTFTYSITPGTLSNGTEQTETITVRDALGNTDTSRVTIKCVAT